MPNKLIAQIFADFLEAPSVVIERDSAYSQEPLDGPLVTVNQISRIYSRQVD